MGKSISTAPSKFIWKIGNFSSLNDKESHYSDNFVVDGCAWYVGLDLKGVHNDGHLSMYLYPRALGVKSSHAEFSLAIFNQKDHKKTVRHEAQHIFPDNYGWGFPKLLPLSDLHHPDKGFIVDDTCIFQVEISACGMVNSLNQEVTLSNQLYPNAAKPFQEDEDVVSYAENSENIGGFNVLKRHVCLYKKIWLKYGHIASTVVMPASSYQSLVTLVTDIMNSIAGMYRCPLIEVSDEMINAWESKIVLAEKLQFNVIWLRSRFDDFKKDFNDGKIQKLKMEAEQDGTNSQSPKVKVKNEPDESRESLPGFMFEGML